MEYPNLANCKFNLTDIYLTIPHTIYSYEFYWEHE